MNDIDKINPTYYINPYMKSLIEYIDFKLKIIRFNNKDKEELITRKSKIKTIYSSLSIENNSLSLGDINSIINNKSVVGNKKEITEAKNIINAYNIINNLNYKDENDFLKTYSIMMKNLVQNQNEYRNHGEAVKKGNKIIYIAPDSLLVKPKMNSLFKFLNNTDENKIIVSALFHYYMVYVHPFSDGNGRMARYWSSLILNSYSDKFKYIPVEEEILINREEYYKSINQSHINTNANSFIEFILKMINNSLDKIIINDLFKINFIQLKVLEMINLNNHITQTEVAQNLNVCLRTVKRIFKVLQDTNLIKREGTNKKGTWVIP